MSGIYNYHVTIDNPETKFPGTQSQQMPFYFGGSQVPISLYPGLQTVGSGIYINSLRGKQENSNIKEGRGIRTSYDNNFNIAMPKLLSRK